MGAIWVVPLPGAEAPLLEPLALEIEAVLHRPVWVGEPVRNVDVAYDPARDQYSSRQLLDLLRRMPPSGADRVLGVTHLDLFVPVLTFVFGEAQLEGPAAVVSSFRLDNRFYGLPDNLGLLQGRLLKEAIHELGHTYGLLHCADTQCVMRSSTYVEQVDLKRKTFCMECARSVLAPSQLRR